MNFGVAVVFVFAAVKYLYRVQDRKYFLTEHIAFETLYELIEFYRREQLVAREFTIVLGEVHSAAASFPNQCIHLRLFIELFYV